MKKQGRCRYRRKGLSESGENAGHTAEPFDSNGSGEKWPLASLSMFGMLKMAKVDPSHPSDTCGLTSLSLRSFGF